MSSFYVETPLEVALRWRAENADAGRVDQRGATVIGTERMDRLTACSIVAQRLWARAIDAPSNEDDINSADVEDFEVVAVSASWGVWDKPKFRDGAIIIAYAQEALRAWIDVLDLPDLEPLGWTLAYLVRAEPIDRFAPIPNRHLPVARLFPMEELAA